ncbi:coiled-coil domain-containing protein 14 isoform X1 [Astyanax mexicanus]|uniref:Coiled-coil domain-containing protein 14 isoform X1 n=1 Tax=Astyanax mexicanus TaxID=7994 RepID=A0A8B9HTI8_ASTMX|nr:coiled-coil domain-containing protein 14 isoform X1 [Astyanax mexicanus]
MARQGKPRLKVVSSGRLTGCGRGQATRKTVVGRRVAVLEPAYSLYSTDSEDQVTTVHKGLDRCAALLNGMLQAEKTAESKESKSKSHFPKTTSSKLKSKVVSGKVEAEKKKSGKKSSLVSHISRKPAPVQKTILCSQGRTKALTPLTQSEHIQPHSLPLACPLTAGTVRTEQQTSTVFNCRLATSTPVLNPQIPTPEHSQVPPRESDGQLQYFTQQWDIGTGGQSSQHGPPVHYTASLPVAPAVQQHPGASTASVHQATTIPGANGKLRVPSPLLSAPHLVGSDGRSTPIESCNRSSTNPSPTMATHVPLLQVPITSHSQAHPQPTLVYAGPYEKHQQKLSTEESSDECGGCSSEEDELTLVDTTPVRDTSCQTSINNPILMPSQKGKTSSPEKTAKKVMTVKYLLGELKTLVANQDSDAVRLISEVEQSISLLPAMVGSTNVQAELALALQPLRSENAQLRRRLRILNQQLLERERAERQARPVDCTLELATLQSLNLTLQTQLSDSQRELGNLQQENQRLQRDLEDKEIDLQKSKEQSKVEISRIRLDVSEALAEMRNCQAKLEASERVKVALTWNVQQKEAEITKLLEIIGNLQKSSSAKETACHFAQTDMPKPPSQLTKSVLDLYENQEKQTAKPDRVSDTIKTYLQTLESTGHDTYIHQSDLHPCPLSPPSIDQGRVVEESGKLHETRRLIIPQDSQAGGKIQEGDDRDRAFVPLRETARVQPAAKVAQKDFPKQKQVDGVSDHPGLNFLGLAFEKLGLPTQDLKVLDDGKNFLSHAKEGTVHPELSQQSQTVRRCLQMGEESAYTGRPSVLENTLSSCDIKSLASDWSVNSWSTFNTRDEQNFRNGLAALDASIASLQKTLKAELKK